MGVGDILFAMIGTIGNPVVITKTPKYAIKNVALFKSSPTVNSFFCKYYLECPRTVSQIMSDAKGTTQKFVSLGYLRNFPFPKVSMENQKEIVSQLDVLASHASSLEIIYRNKLIALEELRRNILVKCFNERENE